MFSTTSEPVPGSRNEPFELGVSAQASLSPAAWDSFLQSNPRGQFQQSAMWGDYKSSQAWSCHRLVSTSRVHAVVAGCQILMKSRRGVRIGYISKGPVLREETPASAREFWRRVQVCVHRERLAALLIQPPDASRCWPAVLAAEGCLPAPDLGIISSTLKVDLSRGPIGLQARYLKTTQQAVRQALQRGVAIREADASDVKTFFHLVRETCQRNGVPPNPPSETAFGEMYRVFAARRCARMTLALLDGAAVAGVFCIRFGRSLTLWKKGAIREAFRVHAMDLLYHDALLWGSAVGSVSCDFGGVARAIAETVLAGGELSQAQKCGRDFFHLRFGGRPELLPLPWLYVPNPLWRFLLKSALKLGPCRSLVKRMLG